jgi:WD40 repeat protein
MGNAITYGQCHQAGGAAAGVSAGAGGAAAVGEEAWGKQSVHDSMLLATGSADLCAYVFDVGGTRGAKLMQRLEGHTDRVHAVSFHPQDPLLATCSADSTIKIWGAR